MKKSRETGEVFSNPGKQKTSRKKYLGTDCLEVKRYEIVGHFFDCFKRNFRDVLIEMKPVPMVSGCAL